MKANAAKPQAILIDRAGPRRQRLVALAARLGLEVMGRDALPAESPTDGARVRLVVAVGDPGPDDICQARQVFPQARLLVCGLDPEQRSAIRAFRDGANDFVWLGSGDGELAARISHHLGCAGPDPIADVCGLVGNSAEISSALQFIRRIAPSDATVLIGGETGTGKECAALLLHRLSRRANGPLVALNCAAIPDELLESELFGFERGAFSGAVSDYPGKMKLADGGTLLLDEIGELSLGSQAKVLRTIETREAYRLGGREPTPLNVRIIAASNRDLEAEVRAGRFREDLYYRLAVAVFRMPPLRERPADIPTLARHLLANVIGSSSGTTTAVAPDTDAALMAHTWPGNARELRNVLEIAYLAADGREIRPADLPPMLRERLDHPLNEREMLLEVLRRAGGNKTAAARALKCSRMTLYRRMARSGIDPDQPAHSPIHGVPQSVTL